MGDSRTSIEGGERIFNKIMDQSSEEIRGRNHNTSTPSHSGQVKFSGEGVEDWPIVIDSGCRGLSLHSPKHIGRSGSFQQPRMSGTILFGSPSSGNDRLFEKGVTKKKSCPLNNNSTHTRLRSSDRPLHISESSTQDGNCVDLAEKNLQRPVIRKPFPRSGVLNNRRISFCEKTGLTNSTSSHAMANTPNTSSSLSEEKDSLNRACSSINRSNMVELDVGNKNESVNGSSISLHSSGPPSAVKQKRLVRNGCISPNNVAKARQLAGKNVIASTDVAHSSNDSMASDSPISLDIMDLVAEDCDSHVRKGKAVVSHPCSSKASDLRYKNFQSRSSMNSNEKAVNNFDYNRCAGKSFEESGGWRNTRNSTRELNMSSCDERRPWIKDTKAARSSSQHHNNNLERMEREITAGSGTSYPMGQNLSSFEHSCSQSSWEPGSHPSVLPRQLNGTHSATRTLIKRQKNVPITSSGGGSSSEVVLLSPSAEPNNSKFASTSVATLEGIVDVDELSPQLSHHAYEEDAMARQLEADELLARELQEQLYNEVPTSGAGEVDEHIALALQHQDDLDHGLSPRRHPVSNARGSSVSNLHRQSRSRYFSNLTRRASQGRGSTSGRMTRIRNRFPGYPRTLLPSRGRTSLFPEDMDIEVRMHILGALEEISNMGMNTSMLHAQRDFNENDYEMLLALDENNHQHGGASNHHINGLPQSVVQSDNFEEACVICLDTPTLGDTIRHLPCLHKFHKECIDPWLRRKTSCPVCKSSIT